MTFDRVLIKEELSRGQLVTSFSIFADGKSVFDGSAIGRTLIVLLDENVTASFVELRITGYKAKPSFRLIQLPTNHGNSVAAVGGAWVHAPAHRPVIRSTTRRMSPPAQRSAGSR